MNFRKLENGYLIAPRRGVPPPPPEGYETAYGDKFVFLPVLSACVYREKKIIKRSCCDPVERLFCIHHDTFVTRLRCQGCTDAKL
jgi:hypothetical protein